MEPYFGPLSGAGNIGGKGVESECRCGGLFDIRDLSEELLESRGLTQSAIQNGSTNLEAQIALASRRRVLQKSPRSEYP